MHLSLPFPASRRSPSLPPVGPPAARRVALPALMLAAALALPAMAQDQARDRPTTYQPEVGQAGKDVVWVPTSDELVQKMLDIAQVTPQDYLMDLGSGDGRTVIAAARRGLTAHGIEYNPEMAELARKNAASAGVAGRATIETGDLFESDLSKADVITMFLLPTINEKLRPHLLELKPGTRVVSNTFRMGDWTPDDSASVEGECRNWCTALLWIVPAKVAGTWRLGDQELKLEQSYQMLTGTLGETHIDNARMRGDEITFTVDGVRYSGRVDGRHMHGTVAGGQAADWSARRL